MSPLLRHPGRVPALFSERTEREAAPRQRPARPVGRILHWAMLVGLPMADGEESRAASRGSLVAGGGLALLFWGKAALAAIGFVLLP